MEKLLIKNFYVKHKDEIIFDICFLRDNIKDKNNIFTSLIIGENGSGKSYLLKLLADTLREVYIHKVLNEKEKLIKYDFYSISYFLNDDLYKYENNKGIQIFLKNNKEIDIKDFKMPSNIIVCSYMINDKFTFSSHKYKDSNYYNYMGLRQVSNAAWVKSIENRVSEMFSESISDNMLEDLGVLFEYLEFEKKIGFSFSTIRTGIFSRKITIEEIENRKEKLLKVEQMRNERVKKIDAGELISFIDRIKKSHLYDKKTKSINYLIDFKKEENEEYIQDFKYMKMLVDLKILNNGRISLWKNEEFEFEFASSGEKHLLFTILGILSKIKQGTLVLIDEPELSLHPNWQSVYINYIKTIFKKYSFAHFILGTHSHFIVSDIEKESSSVISLKYEKEKETLKRKATLLEADTYGWSVENILYEVFNIKTSRNYYIERDISNLLKLVNEKEKNIEKMDEILKKLSLLNLNENDPLLKLIDTVRSINNHAEEN